MDDNYDQFDYSQLDQLLHFLSSSSPPPPSPPATTTLRKQDSSVSLQRRTSNHVSHVPKRKSNTINANDQDGGKGKPPKEKEPMEKKAIRRDVERQRRRDMARLYQRLRLLIPSKYLMGKRSISDHLEEIVDYVKDLQKNIEELETKRETLKKIKNICTSDNSHHLTPFSSMKSDDHEDGIRVKQCKEGVEVFVSSAAADLKAGLTLSKVLRVLMEEGMLVSSCVSSNVNQKLLHIIQSKVNTRGDIDLAGLQFKLMSSSYKQL